MGQARRYILECDWLRTSGVTTVSGITTYDLTDAFSGTSIFGSTFSYDAISLIELANLNDIDYEERVTDFISYVSQFNYSYTLSEILQLIEDGQYDELFCITPTTTTTTTVAPTTTTTTLPPTTTTTTTLPPTTTTTTTLPPTTTTTTTLPPPKIFFAAYPSVDGRGSNTNHNGASDAQPSGVAYFVNWTTDSDNTQVGTGANLLIDNVTVTITVNANDVVTMEMGTDTDSTMNSTGLPSVGTPITDDALTITLLAGNGRGHFSFIAFDNAVASDDDTGFNITMSNPINCKYGLDSESVDNEYTNRLTGPTGAPYAYGYNPLTSNTFVYIGEELINPIP